jgi:predicted nucleic acid-binding Zn ribbon protein
MQTLTQSRHCLQCGEPIRGRKDKKFCDDQCRNEHNNDLNSDRIASMRNTNGVLRRNRRILESTLQADTKIKIPMNRILDAGFKPDHLTHVYPTSNGTFQYCYEYGILMLEENMVLIVKRETLD